MAHLCWKILLIKSNNQIYTTSTTSKLNCYLTGNQRLTKIFWSSSFAKIKFRLWPKIFFGWVLLPIVNFNGHNVFWWNCLAINTFIFDQNVFFLSNSLAQNNFHLWSKMFFIQILWSKINFIYGQMLFQTQILQKILFQLPLLRFLRFDFLHFDHYFLFYLHLLQSLLLKFLRFHKF